MQMDDQSFEFDSAKHKQEIPNELSGFNFDPNVRAAHQVVEDPPQATARAKKSTQMQTSFNIFRSFVGLGILALPYAFSKVGRPHRDRPAALTAHAAVHHLDLVVRRALLLGPRARRGLQRAQGGGPVQGGRR